MTNVKSNWGKLKEIIDEEVSAKKGKLINNLGSYIYGIEVNDYRIIFNSLCQGQYIERTIFESNIPQASLDYYKTKLQPKVIPLMKGGRDTLEFEESIKFL
jgi:hypothetical protein